MFSITVTSGLRLCALYSFFDYALPLEKAAAVAPPEPLKSSGKKSLKKSTSPSPLCKKTVFTFGSWLPAEKLDNSKSLDDRIWFHAQTQFTL